MGSANLALISSNSRNRATIGWTPSSTISRTVFAGSSCGSCSRKQIGNLTPGIAELQLAPRLPLFAFTLRTGVPVAFVVFEDCRAARRTDHLLNGAQCHDQLTQPATVHIGKIFQIEQNLVVSFGNFVTNRLAQTRERLAGGELTREIDDKHRVYASCGYLEIHTVHPLPEGEGTILPLLEHPFDDRFKNRIRIDAFSLAFEIQNHPMAQRRQDHMPYIFASDFGPAAEQRSHFASDDQSLRAARAGAIP